jgi:hypothetical protein
MVYVITYRERRKDAYSAACATFHCYSPYLVGNPGYEYLPLFWCHLAEKGVLRGVGMLAIQASPVDSIGHVQPHGLDAQQTKGLTLFLAPNIVDGPHRRATRALPDVMQLQGERG